MVYAMNSKLCLAALDLVCTPSLIVSLLFSSWRCLAALTLSNVHGSEGTLCPATCLLKPNGDDVLNGRGLLLPFACEAGAFAIAFKHQDMHT